MANKLPDSGPISMLDIYNFLMDPQNCDYYFETEEDFYRINTIIAENNNNLLGKSFGFGDNITNLGNIFKNRDITSTPKMIVGRNLTTAYGLFYQCKQLKLVSPELFKYCPKITDFSFCFKWCSSLREVPEELFYSCVNASDFNSCFLGSSLSSIPEKLFYNCVNATSFDSCFSEINDITTIPEGLFNNCKNAYNFNGCFDWCSQLTNVPFNLFDNCINIRYIERCFYNCSKITSSLPDAWNKTKFPNVADGTDYARLCEKAANYNEIPSNFGGPSTNPPVTLSENTINNTKSLVNNIRTVNIPTSPISLNDKDFRELAGISNGQISLRDFYGKSISVPLKLHIKFKYEPNNKLTIPCGIFAVFGFMILDEENSELLPGFTGYEYIPNDNLILYSDNNLELYKINNNETMDGQIIENLNKVQHILIKNTNIQLLEQSIKKVTGSIIIDNNKYNMGFDCYGYNSSKNLLGIRMTDNNTILTNYIGKYIEIDLQIEQIKVDPNKHYYPFDNNNWNKNEVDKIITTYNGDLSKTTFEFFGITNIGNIFDNNQNIKSTPRKFIGDSVTSVTDDIDSLFEGCKNLTYISPELFLECPNMINFYSAFLETGISDIPQDLFKNCSKAESFRWCFQDCKNLTSIPQNLFSNCPNVNNFSYCFDGCTNITSAVPELWKTHPNADGTACFRGCVNAANYNDIPSSWGGPA